LIELLLAKNADLTITNEANHTPLEMINRSSGRSDKDNIPIIKELLKPGRIGLKNQNTLSGGEKIETSSPNLNPRASIS
jgi:hypothetical protein